MGYFTKIKFYFRKQGNSLGNVLFFVGFFFFDTFLGIEQLNFRMFTISQYKPQLQKNLKSSNFKTSQNSLMPLNIHLLNKSD